jgi:hypothetical protein
MMGAMAVRRLLCRPVLRELSKYTWTVSLPRALAMAVIIALVGGLGVNALIGQRVWAYCNEQAAERLAGDEVMLRKQVVEVMRDHPRETALKAKARHAEALKRGDPAVVEADRAERQAREMGPAYAQRMMMMRFMAAQMKAHGMLGGPAVAGPQPMSGKVKDGR